MPRPTLALMHVATMTIYKLMLGSVFVWNKLQQRRGIEEEWKDHCKK